MNLMLKKLWVKVRFDQKAEWDKVAYSYLKGFNPILDAGCGEGRFISQDCQAIVGIDWNSESIKECKGKGYNVVQGDVRALPFGDESIYGIHCSHVIEHFPPSDVHKILSEFDRVLGKGGILIIRSPLLWKGFYSDLTHVRPYNPDSIIHYLMPSNQRTLAHISQSYKIIDLRWRYRPLYTKNKYLNAIFNVLNRWGFPWVERNGYMLVMQKGVRDG